MTEKPEIFSGIDRPMDLPEDLKSRLIETVSDRFPLLEGIDAPRPVPEVTAIKLASAISGRGRKKRGGVYAFLAGAAVLMLFASTSLILRDRLTDQGFVPRATAGDAALLAFDSPEEFKEFMRKHASPNLHSFEARAHFSPLLPAAAPEVGVRSAVGQAISNPTSNMEAATDLAGGGSDDAGFSTTNVQEKGVDEPDLIKTDGKVIVALASGRLWVVDVSGAAQVMKGSIAFPLPQGVGSTEPGAADVNSTLMTDSMAVQEGQMFLSGRRVVHISDVFASAPLTKVTVVSIEDPTAPKIESETTIEGSLVAARMTAGIVRLVTRSQPAPELKTLPASEITLGPQSDSPIAPPGTSSGPPATAAPGSTVITQEDVQRIFEENQKILDESGADDWLPEFRIEEPGEPPVEGPIHTWKEVQRPKEFSGVSMLSVVTLDPASPSPKDAVSIVGAGEIVYASTRNLYVTSQQSTHDLVIVPRGQTAPALPPGTRAVPADEFRVVTQIHKFGIADTGPAVYRASGQVEGTILNQFSLSEEDGHLRVATTRPQTAPAAVSESFVNVLKEEDGELVITGAVGNLGKGEQIYAVRFIGKVGYVVTFRQTDPLYVVDLSDPKDPRVRGELKIPGFSNYLHPIGEHLLLGVGQDADSRGRVKGLQVSLFDVSNPAKPERIHQRTFGMGSSEAQFDHHAFLYWPATGLLVIPVSSYSETGAGFVGALAIEVSEDKGFADANQISHTGKIRGTQSPESFGAQIRRSLVVRKNLVTYSGAGLLANDLSDLKELSWIAFRAS